MSVLIRGMKKPDNCEVCPYAFCHLDTKNCPITELPDHGDLIDRDAIHVRTMDYLDLRDAMDDAPVVIPAERSESE